VVKRGILRGELVPVPGLQEVILAAPDGQLWLGSGMAGDGWVEMQVTLTALDAG
jgi:hypothetical protein